MSARFANTAPMILKRFNNNMPISVAVCDDEKIIREYILRLIKTRHEQCRVDLFPSGDSLLAAQKEYDIYFLDIQMPGLNGLETAEAIRRRQKPGTARESAIVFITALKEYMGDAFDVNAFHYLVKPLDENKFGAVFSRAVRGFQRKVDNPGKYVIIKNGGVSQKIFIGDVFYFESRNNKVAVTGKDGAFEYYASLREIESAAGSGFFRCHRCYLVNMAYIKRYNSNTIWMSNGDSVYIAQKKYPLFTKAYMSFLKDEGILRE